MPVVRPKDIPRDRDGFQAPALRVLFHEITMDERTLELGEKLHRLRSFAGETCGHAALRRSLADKRTQHRKVTDVSGSKHGYVTRSFG